MSFLRLTALILLSLGFFSSPATGNDDEYYERVRRGDILVQEELAHQRQVELEKAKMEVLAAIERLDRPSTYIDNSLSASSFTIANLQNSAKNNNRSSQSEVNN